MKVRMIVALVAAFVLLSSGLGTGARWLQEARFAEQPISVTSGELKVSLDQAVISVASKYPTDTRYSNLTSCSSVPAGFRKCAQLSKSQLQSFTFMRGDRITVQSNFRVKASGKNLAYTVSSKPSTVDIPKWWTVTAPTLPSGVQRGSQTITATRTFEFLGPATAAEWPGIFADVSSPELVVRAVQNNR